MDKLNILWTSGSVPLVQHGSVLVLFCYALISMDLWDNISAYVR